MLGPRYLFIVGKDEATRAIADHTALTGKTHDNSTSM